MIGFTDAEGTFAFRRKNKRESSYIFNFAIELHIDDIFALESIYKTLGIGSVYSRGERNSVFLVYLSYPRLR